MIKIRAFRAIDDLKSCERFAEGHANVLKDYGITKVTSSNYDWMHNPGVYVLTVIDESTNEILGGERIHLKTEDNIPLPIENAVGMVESKIYGLINSYYTQGKTAELCGLWNSKKIAGQGISVLLTKLGVAFSKTINVEHLFVLCAPYTVKMCQDSGFEIETSIGNKGTFYYPKLDLIATSLIINDIDLLSHAEKEFKDQIISFIQNPSGNFIHKTLSNEYIELQYSIKLS